MESNANPENRLYERISNLNNNIDNLNENLCGFAKSQDTNIQNALREDHDHF